MSARTVPVPAGQPTFLSAPRCDDLSALEADVAVIGVPYGVPYDMPGSTSPSSTAPAEVRRQSARYRPYITHDDYDFGSTIFADRDLRVVDCGDVAMRPGRYAENSRAATAAIRAILERGAVPVVLGGDHAIPIPVLRAYEHHGPIYIVQVDAHLDWRHEREGVTEGLSSPMRRASEMAWVRGMAQVGLRGVGSARRQEVEDARAYGSVLVGAAEVHRTGIDAILRRIPDGERYYVTIDADGLDPSIAPGVNWRAPGGLTYYQAHDLLRGLARQGRIVGLDVVEIVPALDVAGLTSLHAAVLIVNAITAMAARPA